MKHYLIPGLAAVFLVGAAAVCFAGENTDAGKKIVIALKTDDFEIPETDISHLAIGDAETIMTDSGRTIDLLRTADGVEVYVDGELLEPSLAGDGEMLHERVEVVCDGDDACEEMHWTTGDGEDIDLDGLQGEGHKAIMIHEAHAGADGSAQPSPGEHEEKVIVIRKEVRSD